MATPLWQLVASRIANDLGSGPDHLQQQFTSKINANVIRIVYIACASWVMAFLEGYCWAQTAERQASRMRPRYLQAVLRQDVEFFDLKQGSTSEVVTSVSNDSLVVQDALSDKVPNFAMYVTMFAGSYAVGFALLWRLTLVTLPSALLLIIPGASYGRALTGLARRIREQYALLGAVAEQAVSSVRTVAGNERESGGKSFWQREEELSRGTGATTQRANLRTVGGDLPSCERLGGGIGNCWR